MFVKKIYFSGSILSCGISNINAGCCKNLGKNLTIDLDDLKYNIDIFSMEDNKALYEGNLLDLDKESIEKLKKLYKEYFELRGKYQDTSKTKKEIDKVKLNKFYFELCSLDGEKNYSIRCKKTNINIKGYKKVTEECKDILNLLQRNADEFYENGTDLSPDDRKKLNEFKKSNGEFFTLAKITYLEKKDRDSNSLGIVPYVEYLEIYKKK